MINPTVKYSFPYVLVVILLAFLLHIPSCGGGSGVGNNGGSSNGGSNNTPVANAGPDQNVLVGWKVALDGSGSSNASTYSWSLTAPATSAAALSSATVSNPTFTADKAGSYVIHLVVSNGTGSSSSDTVTILAVSPRAVPDTGQMAVYAAGDDGAYINSAPSYTDNGDGTITDYVTGLMWQQCSSGLSGSLCTSGTISAYNWYEATGTADATYNPGGATNPCGGSSLGHSDWRLPADFELMTIVDYGADTRTYDSLAINTTYFPGTSYNYYWSSTESACGLGAWGVEFGDWNGQKGDGVVATEFKHLVYPFASVRCVRGEGSAPVLTDNGDGTITDSVTSLMWQKQDDGLAKTWLDALGYCEGLTFAGHSDWRLPNIKELRSIVDTTKCAPAINTLYFTDTKSHRYWSSTSDATNPTNFAWNVNFFTGAATASPDVNLSNKNFQYYARCVR